MTLRERIAELKAERNTAIDQFRTEQDLHDFTQRKLGSEREVSRALAEALEQHCRTHNIFSNGEKKFADCQCDSCDKARAALAQYAAQSAPVESGTGGGGK